MTHALAILPAYDDDAPSPEYSSRAGGLPARLRDPNLLARHLRTGRQLLEARQDKVAEERLFTGSPLDGLLMGGLPRGVLVELVGRASTGRFSLVLQTLAAATATGENAALIDLGDSLDPGVAEAAGVDLARLLWVRPRRLKEALLAAEAVLACGIPLAVVDLGLPPVPGGRGLEGHWLRLARLAQSRRCALLVASPYRVSGPCAQVVVEADERSGRWQGGPGGTPRLLKGLRSRLSVVKGPGWQEARTRDWELDVATAVACPS